MNCNRCFICNQPIKQLTRRHFESKNCIKKLRQVKNHAMEYDGYFPVWQDLILYLFLFIKYYGIDAKVKTTEFNKRYKLMMETLDFD